VKSVGAPFDRANTDVVLIVDDVPDNLAVLHDALDESGYTVLVATSGEAALQRAAGALPDIVLLDAMMPGMDGFEVARRLKADPRTAPIPIIFMTGLTETEHLVAALESGGVDYVTKPIKPKEVMARMGVHLGGARRARQEARQAGGAGEQRGKHVRRSRRQRHDFNLLIKKLVSKGGGKKPRAGEGRQERSGGQPSRHGGQKENARELRSPGGSHLR